MMSFEEFLNEKEQVVADKGQTIHIIHISDSGENLLEHQTYKKISGTNQSYREDSANTNSKTQQHVHVYAKLKGQGNQLYSVNMDGTGHDGNHGKKIPKKHADYFREKGYNIDQNNILENQNLDIGLIFILLG